MVAPRSLRDADDALAIVDPALASCPRATAVVIVLDDHHRPQRVVAGTRVPVLRLFTAIPTPHAAPVVDHRVVLATTERAVGGATSTGDLAARWTLLRHLAALRSHVLVDWLAVEGDLVSSAAEATEGGWPAPARS